MISSTTRIFHNSELYFVMRDEHVLIFASLLQLIEIKPFIKNKFTL